MPAPPGHPPQLAPRAPVRVLFRVTTKKRPGTISASRSDTSLERGGPIFARRCESPSVWKRARRLKARACARRGRVWCGHAVARGVTARGAQPEPCGATASGIEAPPGEVDELPLPLARLAQPRDQAGHTPVLPEAFRPRLGFRRSRGVTSDNGLSAKRPFVPAISSGCAGGGFACSSRRIGAGSPATSRAGVIRRRTSSAHPRGKCSPPAPGEAIGMATSPRSPMTASSRNTGAPAASPTPTRTFRSGNGHHAPHRDRPPGEHVPRGDEPLCRRARVSLVKDATAT